MPVCEGLPNGPCPKKCNDSSVCIGKGDLLLCSSCDTERRRLFDEAMKAKDKNASSTRNKGSSTKPSADAASRVSASLTDDGGASRVEFVAGRKADLLMASNLKSMIVACPARTGEVATMKKVIWCEVLSYIRNYRDKSNVNALRQVVLGFFSPGDIGDAKRLMMQEFNTVDGAAQFLVDRRNSTVRQAHEAELDDVLGIFDAADALQALDGYLFVASALDQLPKFGPEEINLGVVVDRQVKMDTAIQSLSASIQQLSSTSPACSDGTLQQSMQLMTQSVERRLTDFSSSIIGRIDHLQSVCNQLADSVTAQSLVRSSPPRVRQQQLQEQHVDRSMNIVVFGIAEDRAANVWRQKVDEALLFVKGQTVDVVDAYRAGHFDANKTRPIIVKLRTTWDKRLILSNCNKLKNFAGRIFISPDEPLDERRKRMFDRIKLRAERAGKVVSVDDGVLSVDGVVVFSMVNGNLVING